MVKSIFAASISLLITFSSLGATKLTVEERSGIERVSEPVTCGVPFAAGALYSSDSLILLRGTSLVPVEIREVSRWPDGSLRWVHLDFQASAGPREKVSYSVEKAPSRPPASTLVVKRTARGFTVETGKIRVEVKRRSFNVFDRVLLAGENGEYVQELVAQHSRGIAAWAGEGQEYLSVNDRASTLQVESSGPMRVVLLAQGALKNKVGNKLFDYICRLYFYSGSPVVRLAVTVENRDPVIENKIALQGLHVEIPTTMAQSGAVFHIGGRDKPVEGRLSGRGSNAFILAQSSESYTYGGVAKGWPGGDAKAEGSDRLGWIGMAGPRGAVAVGLRDFWQMYPSSLEAASDQGMISVGLFPLRLGSSVDIYSGVSRTHYLRFAFTGQNDPDLMCSLTRACQKPLVAVAAPYYYCCETRAFGKLVERELSRFAAVRQTLVNKAQREMDRGLANMLSLVESRTKNGVTVEGYGYLDWGDGMHHIWVPGVKDPRNVSWNGHYYDLPHTCCLEYVRTGNWRYYDFFLSRAQHLMDVHVTHFGPENRLNGANRYCPPTDHVRIDPRRREDFSSARVYVSNATNHHKTQGLFDRYFLTGDERSLEVALKAVEFANSFGAYRDFKQPRGAGFQALSLLEAYRCTGEDRYLETATKTFEAWWAHFDSTETKFTRGYFMVGFLLEAFVDYYEITGDSRAVEFIRQAVDWMYANRSNDLFSNMTLSIAFLAHQTGESEYIELAEKHLSRWHGVWENAFKDFGLNARGIARALYYLSDRAGGSD